MQEYLYQEASFIGLIAPLLLRFKQKNEYVWNFRCPFCKDSAKNPNKARGYLFRKGQKLVYKCHNCHITSSFPNLIKHLDVGVYNKYVLERFQQNKPKERVKPKVQSILPKTDLGLHSFAEYADNHWAKQYLLNRMVPDSRMGDLYFVKNFGSWVKTITTKEQYHKFQDEPRIIIPIYTPDKKLIGVQGRVLEADSKSQRYITLRFDESMDLIFGLDKCDFNQQILMVEGPIDSLFLPNCIAATGSDLSAKAKWLMQVYGVGKENLVLIFDNEPRNKEIQKLLHKAVANGFKIVSWPSSAPGKDINDMVLAGGNVLKLVQENIKSGLEAQLTI